MKKSWAAIAFTACVLNLNAAPMKFVRLDLDLATGAKIRNDALLSFDEVGDDEFQQEKSPENGSPKESKFGSIILSKRDQVKISPGESSAISKIISAHPEVKCWYILKRTSRGFDVVGAAGPAFEGMD